MSNEFYVGPNKKGATEDEIASDIIKKFRDSDTTTNEILTSHLRYLKKYMGIADPLPTVKKDSGASNIFVPLIEPHVDTVVAKAFLTLMGQDPFARFVPESQDAVLSAKIMERVFNHYFYNKMKNSLSNMWLWFRNAVLYGTGVVHLYHDKDTHNRTKVIKVPNPMNPQVPLLDETGELIYQEVTEEIVDYDGIRFEAIDLSNFATDWSVLDWRKSWSILREFVDPEVYLTRVETLGYKKLTEDELEALLQAPNMTRSTATSQTGSIENKPYDSKENIGEYYNEQSRRKIELLHYYGKGYINGVRQEVLYTITGGVKKDGKMHVALGPAPFGVKPFAVMRFKPNQDSFLGRGIGAQLEGLQDELNVARNQRIDNVALELTGGWIVEDGAVENLNQLNSKVGQIVIKQQGYGLEKIQRLAIPSDAFSSEESIKQDAQNVTASADLFRGVADRKETATVGVMLNNNAGQRLEAIMMVAMEDGVQDFVNITKTMIIDFSPSEDQLVIKLAEDEIEKYKDVFATADVKIDDNGFAEIPVGLLDEPMHATAKISALAGDNRLRSQEMIQMMQTLLPFAETGWKKDDGSIETIDLSYFIKEILRLNKFRDFKGIFQTLLTADEAKQKQQLEAAQQAAQIQSQTQGNEQQGALPEETGGQPLLQTEEEAVAQQNAVADDVEDRAVSEI